MGFEMETAAGGVCVVTTVFRLSRLAPGRTVDGFSRLKFEVRLLVGFLACITPQFTLLMYWVTSGSHFATSFCCQFNIDMEVSQTSNSVVCVSRKNVSNKVVNPRIPQWRRHKPDSPGRYSDRRRRRRGGRGAPGRRARRGEWRILGRREVVPRREAVWAGGAGPRFCRRSRRHGFQYFHFRLAVLVGDPVRVKPDAIDHPARRGPPGIPKQIALLRLSL